MRLRVLVPAALLALPAAAPAAEGRFERTLNVTGPVEMEIDNDSGGVTVRGADVKAVRVTARIKSNMNWLGDGEEKVRAIENNPPVAQEGNRVRIGLMHKQVDQRGVSISYEIEVPRSTRLKSRCDSGGQTIEGIQGPVDVEVDSGGIRVRDVQTDVRASADSGRIRIERVGGAVIAEADSGGIEVLGAGGRVEAHTDSGGVHIAMLAAADVKVSADSGGIDVKIPPGAGYDVVAEADSGGVRLAKPLAVSGTVKKHRVEGRIGQGGHRLELTADSGGIRISEQAGEI